MLQVCSTWPKYHRLISNPYFFGSLKKCQDQPVNTIDRNMTISPIDKSLGSQRVNLLHPYKTLI